MTTAVDELRRLRRILVVEAVKLGDSHVCEVEVLSDIIDARIAELEDAPTCGCPMRTKLLGDGCRVCNPDLAATPDPLRDEKRLDDLGRMLDAEGLSKRCHELARRLSALRGDPELGGDRG